MAVKLQSKKALYYGNVRKQQLRGFEMKVPIIPFTPNRGRRTFMLVSGRREYPSSSPGGGLVGCEILAYLGATLSARSPSSTEAAAHVSLAALRNWPKRPLLWLHDRQQRVGSGQVGRLIGLRQVKSCSGRIVP